jgi:hypothetical protein
MAYQSTFPGVNRVSKDPSGLLQLATILRRDVTPALNAYTDYKGKEITEKTDREAEIKARSTEAKSYADAVSSGELDGTQSPYWQSIYDNVKGKNHGIQFSLNKQTKLNEWIQNNIQENPNWEDKTGEQYFAWSSKFDAEYFSETLKNESSFFKKGLDGVVAQANANMGTSYVSYIKDRQHSILKKNLENVIINGIDESIIITTQVSTDVEGKKTDKGVTIGEALKTVLDTEGANAKLLAGLKGDEFNEIALAAIQSRIEEYAIKGDPNADYDAALALLEWTKSYKRKNGSTLFNADTTKKWAELEQELYSEKESHEKILDNNRKQLLQNEYIKDTKSNLGYRFTGGPMAISSDLSKEKSKIAEDAFSKLMELYFLENNPDMDNEAEAFLAKQFADNVSDELYKYYRYKDGDQLEPFSIEAFKNRENEVNLNNAPIMFQSTEDLQTAVDQWTTTGDGPIAEMLDEYGLSGKSGVELIIKQQGALLDKITNIGLSELEDQNKTEDEGMMQSIWNNIYGFFRDE